MKTFSASAIFRSGAVLLCSLPIFILSSCSQPEEELSNSPTDNFEFLWKTIDENYCFLEDKKINWDSIHAVYAPRVERLTSCSYAFLDLMEEMLDNLHDGHVNIYTPFDRSVCRNWYKGYPTLYNAQLLTDLLGDNYRQAGGLKYTGMTLDGDTVGYIRYSSFEDSFSSLNLGYVFNYFSRYKGLIVDVRHNGGGSLDLSYRLAAPFFAEKTTVGYRRHKTGTGHSDFSALEAMDVDPALVSYHWQKPVVVLTDRYCYSAANHYCLCMKHAPKAILLGGTTGGGGGMPLSYEMPCGWMIRFSAVAMYDPNYQSIEQGIQPTIAVDTADFSHHTDPVILQAIQVLTKGRSQ